MNYFLLLLILLIIVGILFFWKNIRNISGKGENYFIRPGIFGQGEIFSESEKKIIFKQFPKMLGDKTVKQHFQHCFCQLIRFAKMAQNGEEFKGVQFGLNLGRAQELLKSQGGVDKWWRVFEPLILEKNWSGIEKKIEEYLTDLDLPIPDSEKIQNKCPY